MPETLVPNATRSGQAAYTISGSASTIHGALSDNDDATYVTRNNGTQPAVLAVDMGTFTIGATERVQSVAVETRIARPTDLSRVYVRQGVLTDPASGVVRYATADQITGTASIAWVRGADRTTAPDGQNWSQSAINNLVVQVTDYASASVDTSNIYELRAIVTLNDQPSASITAPTASVTTGSRPAIAWIYADADGDPQTAYEVRVFTAAQAAITGFDPATSPAFFDTGIRQSNDPGVTPDIDFDNSASFVAYVRAGHALGTTTYFSNWDSQSFFVNYDSPPAPELAVSYSERLNVMYVTGTGRTNYLTADDASLEDTVGTWDTVLNCAVVRSTDEAASGVASLKMTATAPGDMIAETDGYDIATDGQTISLRAEFRADANGRDCRIIIYWLDDTDTLISQTASDPVQDSSLGWVTASVAAVPPVGAVKARVRAKVDGAVSAEEHFVDKIALHPGPTPTWGPGGLLAGQVIIGERSVDNGVSWEVFNQVAADTANQVAQFEDYAAPRGQSVWYRAKVLTYVGQTAIASPYSEERAEYVANDGKWWLKALGSGLPGCPCPALNAGGLRVQGPLDTQVETKAGVFYPLGRDRAVVVTGDTYGQDGTLRIVVIGDTEWESVQELLTTWTKNALLQDPFGGQKVIRIYERTVTNAGAGQRWRAVELKYAEV